MKPDGCGLYSGRSAFEVYNRRDTNFAIHLPINVHNFLTKARWSNPPPPGRYEYEYQNGYTLVSAEASKVHDSCRVATAALDSAHNSEAEPTASVTPLNVPDQLQVGAYTRSLFAVLTQSNRFPSSKTIGAGLMTSLAVSVRPKVLMGRLGTCKWCTIYIYIYNPGV